MKIKTVHHEIIIFDSSKMLKVKNKILRNNYNTIFYDAFFIWRLGMKGRYTIILIDFSLTVNATTFIFVSGRGSAISSAKEGKSGFIYNLVKS